ncbi:AAA family ATPase [Paraburkholderia phytofirmans]|uniref:AAA family ATPase n=1 Tax=Paraburkholderia sp. BL9I2N2 TaxID=1938809 RepID=UPI0010471589|nr:AAA family ATPase [Paraburkholderia sp. BL9I2N2]TCK94133.1 AAA domain-containing protein [Paraburkholderia sp. BL9I2N2]
MQNTISTTEINELVLAYTKFPNRFATAKSDERATWTDLVRLLANPPRAANKAACPWIKLARFGNVTTVKKCYRHGANILAISGLEGDYDDEQVSIPQAADRLAALGIEALFYSSGSHTRAKPRWRVVVPLSREYAPTERKRLMAVLNGALGGVLAGESFVDVQSYYFGRVDGAEFESRHVRGEFIDYLDDLGCLPDSVGPRGKSLLSVVESASRASGDDDYEMDRMLALQCVNDETIADLRDALSTFDMSDRGDWINAAQYLRCLEETGFELWAAASRTADNCDPDDELRYRFFSCDGTHTDYRAVFKVAAEKYRWENPRKGNVEPYAEPVETDADGNRINSFQLALKRAEAPIRSDLIKGVIPDAEFGIIFGKSGSGKSFAAIDLGYHLARGAAWRGRKVKQRNVYYIAAEGAHGVRRRAKAYALHHGVDALTPFYTRERAINMHAKNGWVRAAEDINEIAASEPGVIFIDTLSRSIPGVEENSAKDMSQVIENCQMLGRATGSMVIVIAHAGKDDDKGVRGSSTLRAAADFELAVSRHLETQWRCLKLTKAKDDVDGVEFGFELTSVEVGIDEDGDAVFSAVAVPSDDKPDVAKRPQSRDAAHALDVVIELADFSPDGWVDVEQVIDRVLELHPNASKNARVNIRRWISGAHKLADFDVFDGKVRYSATQPYSDDI